MKRPSFALKSAALPSVALALLSAAAAAACGTYDFGEAQVDEVEVSTTDTKWALDIEPLMTLKCVNCHTDTPGKFVPGDMPKIKQKFNVEADFKILAARVEARVFNSPDRPMPPHYGTPLSANELAALKVYLAKLKKEAATNATPKPTGTTKPGETPAPGTLALSAKYTARACNSCHGANGEGGFGTKLAGTALTEAVFIQKVRDGFPAKGMSASPADVYPDADLKKDYAFFKAAK